MIKYEITIEQQKRLNKLGTKLFIQSFLTGIHHAALAVIMNVILLWASLSLLSNPATAILVGSVAIGFFTFRRMHSVIKQDHVKFREEVKKIVKN